MCLAGERSGRGWRPRSFLLRFLGLASPLDFWRLVAQIGVHEPTTTFVVDANAPSAAPVEAIVEDAALEEHERRMRAVRAAKAGLGPGRMPSANKDSVSGSI